MAAVGGLCFDEGTETFHTYEQRFAQFVEACEIPQGKQGAVFLTVVGAKTVALLVDLLAPRTPSECSLDVILNALRDFNVLKKNVLRERYTFRARRQQRGESLLEYVDALKGLAATCEFGELIEEHLRDQLVYGIRSEELRTKLFFAACGEQLEWDKVVDIVNNFESTTRSLITTQQTSSDSESSSKGRQGTKQKTSVSGENVGTRCQTEGHSADTCEYKESQCNNKQLAELTCGNTSTKDAANHGGVTSGQPTAENVSASPETTVLTGPRFRRIHVVIPRSTALQLSRDQKVKLEDDKDDWNNMSERNKEGVMEASHHLIPLPEAIPDERNVMHVTIQRGKSLPTLKRCTRCCDRYHCPFCLPSFFQPAQLNKVRTHLKNHFTRAILHDGYNIHRCGLDCKPQLHYHCLYCKLTPFRKVDFIKHLSVCKKKRSAITPITSVLTTSSTPPSTTPVSPPADSEGTPIPAPATPQLKKGHAKPVQHKYCPICKLLVNKKNLKKHIERRHKSKHEDIMAAFHLQSECVDQEIYIMDKSFFDASTHVQKKVCGERQHVSCELSQCQVEMELAWKSGLKAYQCSHLKSVTCCENFCKVIQTD